MFYKEKCVRIGICFLILLSICVNVSAETVWGDFNARYSNIPTIEYNGETWSLKNRITSILLLGVTEEVDEQANTKMKTEFSIIVVIDDEEKVIKPIEINNSISVQINDALIPLRDASSASTILDMEHAELLNAVNALFPEALIEHYFILNLDDIATFDTESIDDRQTMLKQRVKNFICYAEELSAHDQADLLTEFSGSIVTDLKSGAIMKIADKAERYMILPTTQMSGVLCIDQYRKDWTVLDEQEQLDIVIGTFYEKHSDQ